VSDCELCDRCGVCCYFKVRDYNGLVWVTREPCPFLDRSTNLCMIYDIRHAVPWCNGAIESMNKGASLPEGCPVAKAHAPKNYVYPVNIWGRKVCK
jgi:uncharacterized protein